MKSIREGGRQGYFAAKSMAKRKLGDNPLDALVGTPAPERSGSDKHSYRTVGYRLPPELADEVRAIAQESGVEISQVAAYALATFCKRYRAGEKLPTHQRVILEVEMPRLTRG